MSPKRSLNPDEEGAVRDLFTYHAPDEEAIQNMQEIRAQAEGLARLMMQNCPRCADRSAAIRHVREGVMTANAAIVLKGRSLP